jgi:hypothetical protein
MGLILQMVRILVHPARLGSPSALALWKLMDGIILVFNSPPLRLSFERSVFFTIIPRIYAVLGRVVIVGL